MYLRIIPRLDIKGPNLVKGIHLEGLRVLGKPEEYAKHYYEAGADELLYVDVVASLYERNSLHDIITKTARQVFIPLAVGGGIRSIEDMQSIFRAGADKVSINTAAVRNPNLISEAANLFGSANLVVSIEAIKQDDGNYYAFTDNGREKTGLNVVDWAKRAAELGAGEIILTSVDREGTGEGYELELIQKVAASISVPVIAHGGPGKLSDIKDVAQIEGVTGAAIASMLHYKTLDGIQDAELDEGSASFMKSGARFKKVEKFGIGEIKKYLIKNNILCRT